MGSSESTEADLGPLPQQQIVSMSDGTVTGQTPVAPGVPGRVGTSMKGTAVRAPLRLPRESLKLQDGVVEFDVIASMSCTIHLLAPAWECQQPAAVGAEAAGSPDDQAQVAVWPRVQPDPSCTSGGVRNIACGQRSTIRFDRPAEAIQVKDRQNCGAYLDEGKQRRWPVVLILRPGAAPVSDASHEPPDGTVIACCVVENGQLTVARELIAWGGGGTAYVLKELYGIQEAKGPAVDGAPRETGDNQSLCVVCLTSPKDTALMPCGHFCVCYECGVSIRLSPARNRCPLCRTDVADLVHIDVDADAPAQVTAEAAAAGYLSEAPAEDGSMQPQPTAPAATPSIEDVRAARLQRLDQRPAPYQCAAPPSMQPSSGASASSAAASAGDSYGPLPRKCLQRLMQEMKQIEAKRAEHLSEHGVSVSLLDPQGENLRLWSMTILAEKLDGDAELCLQLRGHGAREIEFEVFIPDNFPVEPPRVRVMRPTFSKASFFVFDHGALCLEILTPQGWSPAMSLLQLGLQVKMMMSQGSGAVTSSNAMCAGRREEAWKISAHIDDAHSDWKKFNM